MSDADWPELHVTDSDIDAPDSERIDPGDTPNPPERAPARGIGLRWSAALAVSALVAAAGAIVFVDHRARTITTVRYQNAPVRTIDAGGCPNGDTCSPLDGLFTGLATAFDVDLPDATPLFGSDLLDNTTAGISRSIRIVRLTGSHIAVAVLTQCRNDGEHVPSRDIGLSGHGPRLAGVIRASGAGCSVAALADVPAGQPVPAASLIKLATDPLILP